MAAMGVGKTIILYFLQAAQIIRSLDLIQFNIYLLNACCIQVNVLGTRNIAEGKTENPKFMALQWEESDNKCNE